MRRALSSRCSSHQGGHAQASLSTSDGGARPAATAVLLASPPVSRASYDAAILVRVTLPRWPALEWWPAPCCWWVGTPGGAAAAPQDDGHGVSAARVAHIACVRVSRHGECADMSARVGKGVGAKGQKM